MKVRIDSKDDCDRGQRYTIEEKDGVVIIADGWRECSKRFVWDSAEMPSKIFWELIARLQRKRNACPSCQGDKSQPCGRCGGNG